MGSNDYGRPFLDGLGDDRKNRLFEELGKKLIADWVAANPDTEYDAGELGEKLTTDWQLERVENRGEQVALQLVEQFGTDEDKQDLATWLQTNKF